MTFAPGVALALIVVGGFYLAGWRRAARRGGWPLWRGLIFCGLALGGTAAVTMADLPDQLWAVAVRMTLLIALVPVAFALGDPVGLVQAAGLSPVARMFWTRPVQILTFPLVAAVLANAWLFVVFFTPILGRAARSADTMSLVECATIVVGLVVAMPMVGTSMLPKWCTDPILLLFAFADGLVDAFPGIGIMNSQGTFGGGFYPAGSGRDAGQAMLALAEVVALPIFFVIFFRWAASELGRDQDVDPEAP